MAFTKLKCLLRYYKPRHNNWHRLGKVSSDPTCFRVTPKAINKSFPVFVEAYSARIDSAALLNYASGLLQ